MKLTIAIPTFNRANKLETALSRLSKNRLENTEIVVIDNASTDHTPAIVEHYLNGPLSGIIRYIRNPINIGAEANFIRCFEQTTTEWLWLLGDDDEPTLGAVDHIHETLKSNPNAIYCNFVTTILDIRVKRETSFVTSGLQGFLEGLDCYSNLAFISAGIFRAGELKQYIIQGYSYSHTMLPYLALIASKLRDSPSSTCVFSRDRIVTCKLGAPSWSYEWYCSHAFLLIEALPTPELRMLLLDKMNYVDPFIPSYSLRLLHSNFLTNETACANYFKRYAVIASLTGAYNRHLAISYLCSRMLPNSLFRQLLNGLIIVSRKRIPVLGRQINKLLDLELGAPRTR